MPAMRFFLWNLTVNGAEIPLRRSWIDWRREAALSSWSGFVQGMGDVMQPDVAELELVAETTDGRRLTGHALVTVENRLRSSFELKGMGALLIDGREPTE